MTERNTIRALAARLLIACALLIPALAQGDECHSMSGGRLIQIDLPLSISFPISHIPPVGTVIYTSAPYNLNYACTYSASTSAPQPMITPAADFNLLKTALDIAGLKLQIIINGNQSNPWIPDNLEPGYSQLFPFGIAVDATLPTNLQPAQFSTISLQLIVKDRKVVPNRSYIPSVTLFKIIPSTDPSNRTSLYVISTPSRLQYVPDLCLVNVSMDTLVQFDRVFAATGHMGTLPQQRPFNVTTQINPSCPAGNLTIVKPGEGPDQEFYLPLTVTFTTLGTERLSSDRSFIFLRNEDGQENGLQMQITDPVGQPVILNQAIIPTKNNFGALHGSTLSLRNTYTAQLSPTSSVDDMKTGKFTTQMIVNILYE